MTAPPPAKDDRRKWVLGVCIAIAIVATPVSYIVGGWQASLALYVLYVIVGAGVVWAIQR